ncbi:MAG: HEAT repeat domain-containing protein [Phycisphaerae bacterium]
MKQALALLMLSITWGGHQQEPPTTEEVAESPNLSLFEDGLLDPESREVDRRRWAKVLLGYDSDAARATVVRLLGLSNRPEVQLALVKEVADRARKHPEQLHLALVDPLVILLGSEHPDLRTAAAQALAASDEESVTKRLGTLAQNADAPLVQRLAAIDALAPNIHRRIVLVELIAAIDDPSPEIRDRVAAALAPAAREDLGDDPRAWHEWWSHQNGLSDEKRLAEQFRTNRMRLEDLRSEFEAYRKRVQQRQEATAQRMREFQREIARSLDAGRLKEALVRWLGDPVPQVALTALGIIKAQMADEGVRPEGDVLSALLQLLHQGSPNARREVLLIVQNVSEAKVVEEVLKQLEVEQDVETRLAILKAIGALNRVEAIEKLVAEIQSAQTPVVCVREAALALGHLAAQIDPPLSDSVAVVALKSRYAGTPVDDVPLRAALLTAMAGVGDAKCAPEFLDAVEFDEPSIVKPAIYGMQRIGYVTKLARLRDLTAHPDPLVRLSAIEAVSRLGHETADLECLLARLNPVNEENELARDAAWRAVLDLMKDKSHADQLALADRLREIPGREVEYLELLASSIDPKASQGQPLQTVLTRLSSLLMAGNDYVQAADHLRQLYQLRSASGADDLMDGGVTWLDASLRGYPRTDPTTALSSMLNAEPEAAAVERIIATLRSHLASKAVRKDLDRLVPLVEAIRSVRIEAPPQLWSAFVNELDELASLRNEPPPGAEASTDGN